MNKQELIDKLNIGIKFLEKFTPDPHIEGQLCGFKLAKVLAEQLDEKQEVESGI